MDEWKWAVARVYSGCGKEGQFCGTAFMISDRYLLTCWHVVCDAPKDMLYVRNATSCGGGDLPVRLVASKQDVDIDVALLELKEVIEEEAEQIPLPASPYPIVKDKYVQLAGYASEERPRDYFEEIVGQYEPKYNMYAVSVEVGKGMSGGPMLYQGKLAGISRLQGNGKTYLIPLSDFQDLLNEYVLHSENEEGVGVVQSNNSDTLSSNHESITEREHKLLENKTESQVEDVSCIASSNDFIQPDKVSNEKPPVIFVSYSHDPEPHKQRVLEFSERLRIDGFDVQLDRYVKGSPEEGWPRWMLNCLDQAEFVLVICTETYYRRFRGNEQPGIGKGVDWEGAIITTEIYNNRSRTLKFVPVILDNDTQVENIPEPLQSLTYYRVTSEDRYAELLDFLNGIAGFEPAEIGTRKKRQRPCATPLSFSNPVSEPSKSDSLQEVIERNVAKKLRLFPALLKELGEEMGLRGDIQPTLIAKKLCNHANPRWPVDKLRQPVCFFLDELQVDSPVKLPKAVEGIKIILGWLLLRGVNEDFLVDQIGQIDPLKGFHLEVGFHEHAPVEVMIAFTGQRCAHYESEPRGHQVRGDRAIDLTRLFDFGYRLEDQAEGIIRAVWQMVYSGDRPKLLGETQQERESYSDQLDRQLNADLRESGGWTKEFYLMAPGYEKSNPLNDIAMSKLLRQRLPSLKMIAFGVKGKGTGLAWAGEELSASVRMFLLELNNYL